METKAAKTLGIIVGGFILCWLPFFTMYLIRAFCEDCIHPLVFSVLFWLGYVNSAINPLIYALFSKDFRFAFKRIICRCFCKGGAGKGSRRGSAGSQLQERHFRSASYNRQGNSLGEESDPGGDPSDSRWQIKGMSAIGKLAFGINDLMFKVKMNDWRNRRQICWDVYVWNSLYNRCIPENFTESDYYYFDDSLKSYKVRSQDHQTLLIFEVTNFTLDIHLYILKISCIPVRRRWEEDGKIGWRKHSIFCWIGSTHFYLHMSRSIKNDYFVLANRFC